MNMNRVYYSSINIPNDEATYIMSSSFRLNDNHALHHLTKTYKKKHVIIYYQKEDNKRNVEFISPFLFDLENKFNKYGINATICFNSEEVLKHIKGDIILDKEYLHEKKFIENELMKQKASLIVFEDNVSVPVEVVTQKEEYSAKTIRPKIHKLINDFIDPIDLFPLSKGEEEAYKVMDVFLESKLQYYDRRNHPEFNYTSGISPYLKYGLISPIRLIILLESIPSMNKDSFFEELIIRRELSYNFVHFNQGYNQFNTMTYGWAYQTMNVHKFDHKDYVYTIEDYIQYKTHDIYFNAAMKEMVELGKMHGYMRMYWCKKIIEWSPSYEIAYNTAIYLNNYYFLDGNTPNGYTGIAWCFGKHDRAWKERTIFGKMRYMNSNGLKRKFDIDSYIIRVEKEVMDNEAC